MGEEARKAHASRVHDGFISRYLSGPAILDIGYRGYRDDVVSIVPGAVGVELDYPGYDGVTLPFAEGSQDAVFASHCLEHIDDYQNAIQDWFRVLKFGGFLVIMVPHQFLYEKRTTLPSRYNGDHKRFYTPASLAAEIEASLPANAYRVRHLADNDAGFDYTIPPARHSGGCYELELVIEKTQPPSWNLIEPPLQLAERSIPVVARTGAVAIPGGGGNPSIRIVQTEADPVAMYDFGANLPTAPLILVLKLDHLGDFIIGLPSLQQVRAAFPSAYIRLVTGSWNRIAATESGVADDVVTYDFFPQNALGWDGKPQEPVERFRAQAAGHFDIAIDLRVDEDTRWLLAEVDAGLRCGIGSRIRHQFLDIALPPEHSAREEPPLLDIANLFIPPRRFESAAPFKHAFHHATDFRPQEGHMIYGPYITLPRGQFRAVFDVQMTGWKLGMTKTRVTLDIARDGAEIGVFKRLRRRDLKALPPEGIALTFENNDASARYEFRVHVAGKAPQSLLRFGGVNIELVGAVAPARFKRSELHIGERLSLLVQLVLDRTRDLYSSIPPPPRNPAAGLHIAIAPFSNSDLRDWPFTQYVELVRLLTDRLDCDITLLGSRPQAGPLDRLAKAAERSGKIRNLGGATAWADVPALLRQADLVICNNSGIAHIAASIGALTLAIYSGSHHPQEWGPRGPSSHAIMATVPCSPCGHDRLAECPFEHRCMVGLAPETVFVQVCHLLEQTAETS